MTKRRPPWGLMGLLGLGGLMMMGASSGEDGQGDDASGDDPTGNDPDDSGGDSGGAARPDDPETPADDPGLGDLPSPPEPDPEPDDASESPKPTPKPGLGTPTSGHKPPVKGPSSGGGSVGGGTIGGDDSPSLELPTNDNDLDEPPAANPPPWSQLVDPYPRGGRFYQSRKSDRFGGTSTKHSIAYRFLLSEAYLAAVEVGGLDRDEALAWAIAVAKQDKVRVKVIDLIQCSGWNDAMYGADPVKVSHASQHGRSILLQPVHGPTEALLENGETPLRNITMAGNPANGAYRERELLWQPGIDRVVLWDSGGSAITTTDMVWPDGTSMENPPPWVMALGIRDESGALSGDFGCPGSDGELEVEA